MVIKEKFDDSNYQSQPCVFIMSSKKTKNGIIKCFGLYFDNYIFIISTVFTDDKTKMMYNCLHETLLFEIVFLYPHNEIYIGLLQNYSLSQMKV